MRTTLTLTLITTALAASPFTSNAAVLASGPDSWTRGTVANNGSFASDYYGWDVFDVGTPGPFGNSTLDDSSPDIGVDPGAANATQGDMTAYGLRSSTGNLYSGFQGDALNLDLTLTNNGSSGSGSTTVFLTFIGNPASNRALLPFTLSDGTTTFAPDAFTDGLTADLILGDGSNQRIWVAEWRLTGNTASYSIGIDSDLASGNGTDVAIDSVTVDIAWVAGAQPLQNSFANINLIPEPSAGILALVALAGLGLRRTRSN